MITVELIAKDDYAPVFLIKNDDLQMGIFSGNIVNDDHSLYYISSLIIIEKNKGFGTSFIKFLKYNLKKMNIVNRIELEGTPESLNFWLKNDFKIINDIKTSNPNYKRMICIL